MKRKSFFLLAVYIFSVEIAMTQVQDPDSLFAQARQMASGGKYQEALGQMNLLRKNYPQNADYTLYAARLYYWSGRINEGYELVNGILADSENTNEEAFKFRTTLALQTQKYEMVLDQSDKGMHWFPDDKIFYSLLKAQALEKLGKESAAIAILDSIPYDSEKFPDAQYLKTGILQKKINTISLGYLFTGFSRPYFNPWHYAHFQYLAKTRNCAYIGRVNFAALFGKTALQAEFDAYPKISPKSYLYLNTGLSNGVLFPYLRIGAEFYSDIKSINTSLGFRYLYFSSPEQILLFTGHFAVNFGAFKIAYRPYLLPQNGQYFPSHVINLRQSFENKEAYVQLDFQYGAIPYYFFSSNEFVRNSAYRVGVDFKFRIGGHYFLQPVLMYELEEYLPGTTRNRYNLQITLSKRF